MAKATTESSFATVVSPGNKERYSEEVPKPPAGQHVGLDPFTVPEDLREKKHLAVVQHVWIYSWIGLMHMKLHGCSFAHSFMNLFICCVM